MGRSIIIIGAGMAGLSAGCYAGMNGYRTTIFEKHSLPGGLCTAWKRKGYKFDISMHMLSGSIDGPFNQMWRELGVIKNFTFHYHDHFLTVEGLDKKLTFVDDKEKLEDMMITISKEDAPLIKEFTSLIFGRDMMNAASLKPEETRGFSDRLKMISLFFPLLNTFRKYRNKSVQDFALRFKDPFLQKAVRYFIDGPGWAMPDYPMITLTGFIYAGLKKAGVPLGGSQQVAYKIADLYRQLGGEFKYNSKVTDLIIENDKVTGIVLEDGTEHRADHVIWAADGHMLIYDILKGKYISEKTRNMYGTWIPVKPIMHVMMGVNRDFSGEAHKIIFELDRPEMVAGKEINWLSFLHHSFDPSMAPTGKSAVEVWIDTDFDYWQNLAADREKYEAEKNRIAEMVISHLDKRFPGFASQVEVVDVPTPATYYRYTGNWKGSPDGWAITNASLLSMEPIRSLPGLDGIYMAGQWTAPYTGTVIAALSGRQIVELMCKKEGKKFLTTV